MFVWKETVEGIIIPIKVIPKAHKNEIVGWEHEELKVRIAAVPDQGKANEELIAFLAKEFKISKSMIKLVYGQSSRHKRICIAGIFPSKGSYVPLSAVK
jgi:uncharacterized protein (TIGR00251 family)